MFLSPAKRHECGCHVGCWHNAEVVGCLSHSHCRKVGSVSAWDPVSCKSLSTWVGGWLAGLRQSCLVSNLVDCSCAWPGPHVRKGSQPEHRVQHLQKPWPPKGTTGGMDPIPGFTWEECVMTVEVSGNQSKTLKNKEKRGQ